MGSSSKSKKQKGSSKKVDNAVNGQKVAPNTEGKEEVIENTTDTKIQNNKKPVEKKVKFENVDNKKTPSNSSIPPTSSDSSDQNSGGWSTIVMYVVGALLVLLAILYQCEVKGETQLTSKTAVIHADREQLFQFIADLENYNKWFPSYYSIYQENKNPIGVGKSYIATDPIPVLGDSVSDLRIISYDPPSSIMFSTDHWTKTKVEIKIKYYKDRKDLITINWSMSTRMSSYLAHVTVCPIMTLIYNSKSRQGLFNLKMIFRPHQD